MNELLDEYWRLAGAECPPVVVTGADRRGLPSALATTELAVGSVAAASSSAAALLYARGGGLPRSTVDVQRVAAAFRSERIHRLDGRSPVTFAPLSGFWRTRDGWIRTHANYPHHRTRLLTALGLPSDATAQGFAGAVADRSAQEIEDQVSAAGGICVATRSRAQWEQHGQARAVAELPLVSWQRLGDAARRELPSAPSGPALPAAGIRVLDLTRVVAGPVATRTLALLGAEVMRVDPPELPEISWQHLDSGMGKRSVLLDLRRDPETFDALLADADVVVAGYRPGALARLGLAPAELARRRPGLVVATLSAWGDVGPWGDRRGFDSIVQAATGIAYDESPDGVTPGALPAQALDHATGYLLAAGVLRALAQQAAEGGTWHVRAHLARTAQWLLEHPAEAAVEPADLEQHVIERQTPSGLLRYAAPAVLIDGGPRDWATAGGRWGVDRPAWSAPPAVAGC